MKDRLNLFLPWNFRIYRKKKQQNFLSAMDYAQAVPSHSQAQRIKKLALEGECTLEAMCEIMNEVKKENWIE